jgi:alkylation response protein AidB-like acyl-CoA dehydrogenase
MDFALSSAQEQLQRLTRRFATEELTPESLVADSRVDPVDCYAPELVKRASELGLRTLKIPREYGGHGADCLTEVIVLEELCTGDVGFGMSLQHAWREGYALAALATPDQRDRYLPDFLADPTYLTSLAITEEHFGSDSSGSSDDPADGPRTRAVRVGDEWVLNGAKRWITNANVGRIAFVLARTDDAVPWRQGCSLFLVPTDTPGYRVGRIEDKLGIRMNPNAEIILDDCRVPAGNLFGELNQGSVALARMARGSKAKTATKALGIARAAYEEAVTYARARVQGGRPIVEHQLVSARLVEMEASIEAVRSLIWRAAWSVDRGLAQASRLEAMAKASASEVAVAVATAALELHGSYGIQRGRRIEKLMRDAAAILHTGVGNHALRAQLGRALAGPAALNVGL